MGYSFCYPFHSEERTSTKANESQPSSSSSPSAIAIAIGHHHRIAPHRIASHRTGEEARGGGTLRSHFGASSLMRPQHPFARRTRWSGAARKIETLAPQLLKHFKACQALKCRRCRAAVNFTIYIADYPWLTVANTSEGLRYGCSVCANAEAALQGPYGTGTACIRGRSCVRRHEKSKAHQVAKAKLAGQVQEVNGHWVVSGRVVPSAAVIKNVR